MLTFAGLKHSIAWAAAGVALLNFVPPAVSAEYLAVVRAGEDFFYARREIPGFALDRASRECGGKCELVFLEKEGCYAASFLTWPPDTPIWDQGRYEYHTPYGAVGPTSSKAEGAALGECYTRTGISPKYCVVRFSECADVSANSGVTSVPAVHEPTIHITPGQRVRAERPRQSQQVTQTEKTPEAVSPDTNKSSLRAIADVARDGIARFYSDLRAFLDNYEYRAVGALTAAVSIFTFLIFSIAQLIRTGKRRLSDTIRLAGTAFIGGSLMFAGKVAFDFLKPRVTSGTASLFSWVSSLSFPELALGVAISGVVLLMVPLRFWQALQRLATGNWSTKAWNHIKRAAEARARSYPLPATTTRTDFTSEEIPIVADAGPMLLKIKKSQTTNFRGQVLFMIDARMEISAEEHQLVRKYDLGKLLIYSSSKRDKHLDAMKARSESTKGGFGLRVGLKDALMGILKMFFSFAMAGAHAAMAAYHLKITVQSLLSGVHVRCKNMNEVLVAKRAITEAGQSLRSYLDAARSFDGSEEVHEF